MKIQIEERHLNTLLRHGETALLQAHLLTKNPLFAPGAQSFVEELTDAIAEAREQLAYANTRIVRVTVPSGESFNMDPRS